MSRAGKARASGPFSPAVVGALLLVGGGAFLLALYSIGAGWTGDRMRVTAHANSNALDGYSALVDLLDRRGFDVSVTREASAREDYETVLVLTPGLNTDPAVLQEVIHARAYVGPTIVILPKWQSAPLPDNAPDEARDDWVQLGPGSAQFWFEGVEDFAPLALGTGGTESWRGLGLAGDLPDEGVAQAIVEVPGKEIFPLVTDAEGDILAGYWNDNGWFPELADAADISFSPEDEEQQDDSIYPLIVVAEPDLMNNYGLADIDRATLAVSLVEVAMLDADMPVVFDMTMPGFGNTENLLTLAFRPPFLAATLCLLAAMLLIGWRAFLRFGPPVAETPAMAMGKARLARNSAALIERARRWRLLGAPYAALVATRLAAALNVRESEPAARELAIDAALSARGAQEPGFAAGAEALRTARRPVDILRAARTLKSIERTLVK